VSLKVALFFLIKNEAVFQNQIIDMINEFADVTYILDHGSSDRLCSKINESVKNLKIFKLDASGYPQDIVANFFARKIFEETIVDFIIFIDADELLPFANRKELDECLFQYKDIDYLQWKWENIFPLGSSFDSGFLTRGRATNIHKIILSRAITNHDDWIVPIGYHKVVSRYKKLNYLVIDNYSLYHIPIVSREHLLHKLSKSLGAWRASRQLRFRGDAWHWRNLADRILKSSVSNEDIMEMCLTYSGSKTEFQYTKLLDFIFPYVKNREFNKIDSVEYLMQFLIDSENIFSGLNSKIRVYDDRMNVLFDKNTYIFHIYIEIFLTNMKKLIPGNLKNHIKQLIGRPI
jgi:hypothetical protein